SAQRDAGAAVLDVRNPDEYDEAHVPDVILIPLGELVERVDEVPAGGTLPVICRSGARSLQAAEWLRGQGIDAVNVVGGTLAWIDAGLPVDSAEG
ncbi:MAG TPA: rhodanese-like domain-containing protein, partial [Acidimicrobiales bacterium]